MGNGPDRRAGQAETPLPLDEAARRAAALGALIQGQPAKSTAATFWTRHGGRIALGGILLLMLIGVATGVRKFMRTSISETARSEQELRRGMR